MGDGGRRGSKKPVIHFPFYSSVQHPISLKHRYLHFLPSQRASVGSSFAPRAPGAALATCRTFPSERLSLSHRPTPADPRRTRASELPPSGIHPVLPIWDTAASSAGRIP